MSRPLRFTALTIAVASVAPHAFAQEADLVGQLASSVRCSAAIAKEDLGFNISKLGTPNEATAAALNTIAADATRCEPLRQAAAELAPTFILTPAPTEEELAASAARAMINEVLAEAEAKAESLKFDVGPPPRNMTKGRAPAF